VQNIIVTRSENTTLVQWAENRLKILVEGHMCKDIVAKTDRGIIKMDDCSIVYIASDTAIHRTTINIGIKTKNGIKWLEQMDLPVISLPDPEPSIGGYAMGEIITKSALFGYRSIWVPVNMGFEMVQRNNIQRIIHYSVRINRGDSCLYIRNNIEGAEFPPDFLDFIRANALPGDLIRFFDIETILYDKEKRHLANIYQLTIN